MEKQEQPVIQFDEHQVGAQEALEVFLGLMKSDEGMRLKFINAVLSRRLKVAQSQLGASPNGHQEDGNPKREKRPSGKKSRKSRKGN